MSPYFGVIADALKDNISPQRPNVMNFYIHISYCKSIPNTICRLWNAHEIIKVYSDISKFQI